MSYGGPPADTISLTLRMQKFKYGDERKWLETLQALFDHLLFRVRNVDFSRDSFFRSEDKVARDFWKVNAV